MHDFGPYGTETCRGQRYRYQTPLNLLIYWNLLAIASVSPILF